MTPFLPVKAIAFDCFGTLVEIQSPSNVYRDIVGAMPKHFQPPARQALMTNPWTLAETVGQIGIPLDAGQLAELTARLDEELRSIVCFEETLAVLSELKARGYKLALCSNLALPYVAPVEKLVGAFFDAKLWSFEVGATKPDRRIYQALCEQLALPPEDVLMVGDSHLSDFTGSRAAGLQARHLTRNVPHRRLALNRISSLEDLLRLVR
jgi:HAD superfamily hydrolase (TIGR01549 family)